MVKHHKHLVSVHLCVLSGDLQQQGQGVVIKGIIQGEQCTMDATLTKVAAVLFETNGLNPTDDTLITPHQHIWKHKTEMSDAR